MFNEHLSIEDAKERMQQRMQEAETYRLHKQLGYSDDRIGKWVFVLLVVVTALAVVLL